MTGTEIRKQINKNNETIVELMKPNQFILNTVVRDLLFENQELQKKCPHEFDEAGFCIYCDMVKL